MNECDAKLIGFLLSDGSVYFDKSKRCYCIQFTNKIKNMREVFKQLVKESLKLSNCHENKCSNAISVRFFSTKNAKRLLSKANCFRTLPCFSSPRCNKKACLACNPTKAGKRLYPPAKIPEEILENKSLLRPFLQAFSSADGCFYRNRSHPKGVIEISCYHPNLKEELNAAFCFLGVESRITPKGIVISKCASVEKFAREIAFLDESVVSDSNSPKFGMKKNELLNSCFPYS